jgi:hypothetical protein
MISISLKCDACEAIFHPQCRSVDTALTLATRLHNWFITDQRQYCAICSEKGERRLMADLMTTVDA